MGNEKLKNEILLLFSQYYKAPPEEKFIEKLVEISSRFEPPVMQKIAGTRYLPKQKPRVETGVLQFGDDWQGVFLRGDYCMDLLTKLSKLLNGDIQPIEKEVVYDFHELLKQVKE